MQIISIFFIGSSRILLQLTTSFFIYSANKILSNNNYPSYKSITPNLLDNSGNLYVLFAFYLMIFLEIIAISLASTLLCQDTSLCRKVIWSSNTCYGQFCEMLIEIYIQCDFIVNTTVRPYSFIIIIEQ